MARREKFGKLVLLAERGAGPLGVEHLAARLGPDGFDRLVSVLRYRPEISGHPEAVLRLTDEARRAARLHDPGLLRLLGVGNVGPTFYVSFEHAEGKTLAAIIDRCRADRFPIAADNALLVVSRAAATLDFLHGRTQESGKPLFHGLLTPQNVFVTYAGEVKLAGLGLWPGLRETGLVVEPERSALAPEQRAGGEGGPRSDVYSLGRLLLEMLTLERPSRPVTVSSLSGASLIGPGGEPEPIPAPVADILRRALADDPGARYPGMGELRNAVDTLLFSGELSSTTFNLAFFIHTLFRHEIEGEAAEAEEARAADYSEFLAAPAPGKADPFPASALPAADGAPTAELAPASTLSPQPAAPSLAETRPPPSTQPDSAPAPDSRGGLEGGDSSGRVSPTPAPDSSGRHRRFGPDRPSSDGSAAGRVSRRSGGRGSTRRAGIARGPTPPSSRRGLVLLLATVLAVVFGSGIGYFSFLERPGPGSTSPTTTLSPEAAAALLRVRELEARIAELEREKASGEEQDVEAAAGPATPPSPAAVAPDAAAEAEAARVREAARAEARRRAKVEQDRREAELRRLEEEKRTAEALLVREQQAASTGTEGQPALPAVAPPPPTPAVPLPTPPPVERGSLVEDSDPEVTPPVLLKEATVLYPPVAEHAKQEGSVVVEALVDENGRVVDVKVIQPASSRVGFEEAAVRVVRSRRYRPATKRGVPVKIRVRVRVDFNLAR